MNNCQSVEVLYKGQKVGLLSIADNGRTTAFQYSQTWQNNGFSISPFTLPLNNKVYIANRNPFKGMFGVFFDCLPDGWGSLTLERYLKSLHIQTEEINSITRLTLLGRNSFGALEFKPCQYENIHSFTSLDYDALYEDCTNILKDEDNYSNLDTIFSLAGSSGGARPKINVSIDGQLWIVKYPSLYDKKDIGLEEFTYNQVAQDCGIIASENQLISSKRTSGFFATKRFDRTETNERIHMISASGVLEADYTTPCLDYLSLLKLTWILCKSDNQVKQMFKRMCFNVFAHNRDDHAKNFAFLYDDIKKKWSLSPAFDLTYSNSFNGWHATSVNGNGLNPTMADVISVGEKVNLDKNWCEETANSIANACSLLLKRTNH